VIILNYEHVRPSSGTAVYPHMPRSWPGVPRALAVSGWVWRLSAILAAARQFVRFWAYGEQSFPKWEIRCPRRPWTNVQNLQPLAYPAGEIRNRTNKHTQIRWVELPCI